MHIHSKIALLAVSASLLGSGPAFSVPVDEIRDLGAPFPQSTPNVSVVVGFSVYKWKLRGDATLYQVNSSTGEALTAFHVSRQNAVAEVGVGSARMSVASTDLGTTSVVPTTRPQCPCTTTKSYEDENVAIYIVTDVNGTVVQIIVVPKPPKRTLPR